MRCPLDDKKSLDDARFYLIFALKIALNEHFKGLHESVQKLENPTSGRALRNGAKRIRTADPLHAIEVFNTTKTIANTGLTLN